MGNKDLGGPSGGKGAIDHAKLLAALAGVPVSIEAAPDLPATGLNPIKCDCCRFVLYGLLVKDVHGVIGLRLFLPPPEKIPAPFRMSIELVHAIAGMMGGAGTEAAEARAARAAEAQAKSPPSPN